MYLLDMGDNLRSLLRWLLRIDRQHDPLLETYLQRNREALERQRIDSDEPHAPVLDEPVIEERVEELIETLEVVDDKPNETPESSQNELPLGYEDAPPDYWIKRVEIEDSIEPQEKRRAGESK